MQRSCPPLTAPSSAGLAALRRLQVCCGGSGGARPHPAVAGPAPSGGAAWPRRPRPPRRGAGAAGSGGGRARAQLPLGLLHGRLHAAGEAAQVQPARPAGGCRGPAPRRKPACLLLGCAGTGCSPCMGPITAAALRSGCERPVQRRLGTSSPPPCPQTAPAALPLHEPAAHERPAPPRPAGRSTCCPTFWRSGPPRCWQTGWRPWRRRAPPRRPPGAETTPLATSA